MPRYVPLVVLSVLAVTACQAQYCTMPGGPGAPGSRRAPNPNLPVDRMVLEEGRILNEGMGMQVPIYFGPDNNSYALPPMDASVIMGDWLCKQQIDGSGPLGGAVSICWCLAHEFAHHFQFRFWIEQFRSLPPPGRDTEMQADVLAGYWTGLRVRAASPNPDRFDPMVQQLALESVRAAANMGDFAFWSPSHHGTPNQRAELVRTGGAAGYARGLGDVAAFRQNQLALMQWSMDEVRRVQATVR